MTRRYSPWFHACAALALSLFLAALAGGAVLARVDLVRPVSELNLPVRAYLSDGAGQDYVLAVADAAELDRTGWPYAVLDTDAEAREYLLATWRGRRPLLDNQPLIVLHDDGRRLILRADPARADSLAALGFELGRLSDAPLVWPGVRFHESAVSSRPGPGWVMTGLTQDVRVAEMIADVKTTNLFLLVRDLSGEHPAVACGDYYSISSRCTSSGTRLRRATEYAFDYFQAFGYTPAYHRWSSSGYSGSNVIAAIAGTVSSSEIVLVVAHLDDVPTSGRAPGADDNASGSAAVLLAANVLGRYAFERTIRFCLVTGEEQGMLGSAAYATLVYNAGENVVAVLNMDMIAWDDTGGPTLRLHTRTTGNAGYAGDRAIAETFTNVVLTYLPAGALSPIITTDGETASDHSSFWNRGYPAILAIEDDYSDFSDYYHTANDRLSTLDLVYFTRYVQAAVGTVAHLARPAGGRQRRDVIEVAAGDWVVGGGVGVGTFHARHAPGATESGADARDLAWSGAPANPNARWFKVYSEPYGTALKGDSRPTHSDTIFSGKLAFVDGAGSGLTTTGRLRFAYISSLETDRVYLARIHVDAAHEAQTNDFTCVTNLRQVIAQGGFVSLPRLRGITNGVVFGTCDIGCRTLDHEASNFPLRILGAGATSAVLSVAGQMGATVVNTVEGRTNLATGAWSVLGVSTNYVAPKYETFESGWSPIEGACRLGALTNSPRVFFRLTRQWLGL